MKCINKAILAGSLAFFCHPLASQAEPPSSSPAMQREFGVGHPAGLKDLPPGKLSSRIETLPAAAQKRALEWLRRFSFPDEDLDSLNVDNQGGVFYIDQFQSPSSGSDQTIVDEPQQATEPDSSTMQSEGMSSSDIFSLHSRPGASRVVYLDFNGHVIQNTAWNNGSVATLYAHAFDIDGSPSTFSQLERDRIAETWHRVAEDFAAFDVDVTTEDPINFGPTVGRLLITRDEDINGVPMPAQGAGGVAYVGVFGTSYYQSYSPALVYYDNLGSGGYPAYIAEAASHEFGHNMGLSHDGTSTAGYYTGHGSGYVSWAPIMGVGYYASVTQWSKGEYTGANNTQDDLAILSSQLGYRFDDHDNSYAGASPLLIASDGSVTATNPQSDPGNTYTDNKGVIDRNSDIDFFSFETAEGTITINAKPAWAAFYLDNLRGANLDLQIALYDAQNLSLPIAVSDPLNETQAQIQATVEGGSYYLSVRPVGNNVSPYSNYGSMGQYYISGSVIPVIQEPVNNPPVALNDTATANEDTQVSINVLANDSDIDTDTLTILSVSAASHGVATITGSQITYLPANDFNGSDSFYYTVSDGNGGNSQATVTVTVNAVNDAPVALNDTVVVDEDMQVSINVLLNDTDIEADTLTILAVGAASHGVATITGSQITYLPANDFNGSDSFNYTVSDGNGGNSQATVAVIVNAVNDSPVAFDDSYSLDQDSSLTLAILTNDTDIDDPASALTISVIGTASYGRVQLAADSKSVIYTPSAGFTGIDSFNYTLSDSDGATATATVFLDVQATAGVAPLAPSAATATDGQNGNALLSWIDNSANESSFQIERQKEHRSGRWVGSTLINVSTDTTTLTDASGTGLFRYRVMAVNATGASSWSDWSNIVNVTSTSGSKKDNPKKGGGKK